MTASLYDTPEPDWVIRCRQEAVSEMMIQVGSMYSNGQIGRADTTAFICVLHTIRKQTIVDPKRDEDVARLFRKVCRMYLKKRLNMGEAEFFFRQLIIFAGPFCEDPSLGGILHHDGRLLEQDPVTGMLVCP